MRKMLCTGTAERIWIAISKSKAFCSDNNLSFSIRIRLARLFTENRETWNKKLLFHYKVHISQRLRINWLWVLKRCNTSFINGNRRENVRHQPNLCKLKYSNAALGEFCPQSPTPCGVMWGLINEFFIVVGDLQVKEIDTQVESQTNE